MDLTDVPATVAKAINGLGEKDWQKCYLLARQLRQKDARLDLALDLETRRARLTLKTILQQRAQYFLSQAAEVRTKRKLWAINDSNRIYMPLYNGMTEAAIKYAEAAYCVSQPQPHQWPMMDYGPHMPLALLNSIAGDRLQDGPAKLAICEESKLRAAAMCIIESQWHLPYEKEVFEDEINDFDLDDDERRQAQDLLDIELYRDIGEDELADEIEYEMSFNKHSFVPGRQPM